MTDPVTAMTDVPIATIGLGPLRPAPAGLPDPVIAPPVIAEAGDPFTAVRVIDLLARLERGTPIRLADVVDRLNATYLDWLFSVPVVADVALQLQVELDGRLSQQLGDRGRRRPARRRPSRSRTRAGSTRGSSARPSARRPSCTERLAEFSRRDRLTSGD